ncbi:MAG: PASTA domain-containing protein [Armatimonadota bacterium]
MATRGLGRDQIHDAAWRESYPHPVLSCMMPMIAVLALVAMFMAVMIFWKWSLPGDATIPSVEGLKRDEAERELRRAGFSVVFEQNAVPSELVPAGAVISIKPPPGRRVKRGRQIHVTLSDGTAYTLVPEIREIPQAQARQRLHGAELYVTSEKYIFSNTIPFDRIISVTPAPKTKMKRFSTVSLTISKGPPPEVSDIDISNMRSSVINVDLPTDSSNPAMVRIDVTDDEGKRTVYEEEHNPGDTIIQTVQGTGPMKVEVFFGDQLILTREL